MRIFPFPLAAFALFLGFLSPHSTSSQEKNPMNVKRLTTVLLVKEIEPVIPFWVDRLRFTKPSKSPTAANSASSLFRGALPK